MRKRVFYVSALFAYRAHTESDGEKGIQENEQTQMSLKIPGIVNNILKCYLCTYLSNYIARQHKILE